MASLRDDGHVDAVCLIAVHCYDVCCEFHCSLLIVDARKTFQFLMMKRVSFICGCVYIIKFYRSHVVIFHFAYFRHITSTAVQLGQRLTG